MNPLTRLADALHHARAVRRNHDRMKALHADFDTATGANAAVIALQISSWLGIQADHLEASRLARATTALPTPARLRADAARWQARSDILFAEAGAR